MHAVGFRSWQGDIRPLPEALRDGWVRVVAGGLTGPGEVVASLEVDHDGAPDEQILLRRAGCGRFDAVWFATGSARRIRLRAFGRLQDPGAAGMRRLGRIGSAEAALRLLGQPGALIRLLHGGPASPAALKQRLREAQAAVIGDRRTLSDYATWTGCFAAWSENDIAELPGAPEIGSLVFAKSGDGAPARATLASLRGQRATPAVIAGGADWRDVLSTLDATIRYIGILQAGEVLVPHAIRLARLLLPGLGEPAFATADEDRLDNGGRRLAPSFRPQPNHALMLSGTPARGFWLVRRDIALDLARSTEAPFEWAELLRLELWLRHREAGGDAGRRLPHILSSARPDTERAPAAAVAAVVGRHLARTGLAFEATPTWPVRLRPVPTGIARPVTAIVPSTLTAPHAARCLRAILSGTDYAGLTMTVVVAQRRALDPEQRAVAGRLAAAHPSCRIVHLPVPSFNFAQAVNHGAATAANGADVLLLNDDVEPAAPDWLTRMAVHLTDPLTGIVGARLLYPDGSMQHGGIIMGLAGFCEHAFRHLPAGSSGYEWRASLPQQLLAATGACLLVRASLWHRLGGMDEHYPSAFNDVDLCLRAGETGAEIVLSDATLIHHELQTYGSHYAGDRAAYYDDEVERMRRRWAQPIASDPFYSPNLDLYAGRQWTPCYPPRLTASGGEPPSEPEA